MTTPVVEQARQRAKDQGQEILSEADLQPYVQQLARASLLVTLGPSRSMPRGDDTDRRSVPDYQDYCFFKEMLEKTAINEFFQQEDWGVHRVVLDTVQTAEIPRVPAYRVFWNERQRFLALYESDSAAFEAIVAPMVASVSVLLGADWANWSLEQS